MNTVAASLGQARKSQGVWFAGLALAVAAWFAIYRQLLPFAQWLVAQIPIEPGTHLASSIEFFFYDTPKVLMLLTLVVFAMGVVRTFFSPERTRALLAGKREGLSNIAAAPLARRIWRLDRAGLGHADGRGAHRAGPGNRTWQNARRTCAAVKWIRADL